MSLFASPKIRIAGFFLLLIIFCCAPVWSVEDFITQDGSAHVYSSFIMLELLRGNPNISEYFALNSISIPNSSGHWLMALLLNIFSASLVTKIIVTLVFAGLVASIGWLRFRTVGTEGVKTSFLIGAAISFNWLWLCGFYNFLIGVCCFVITTGLFFGWREKMNWWRTMILSLLFLLAYSSHIVSFAILAGSIFLLSFSTDKKHLKRNLLCFGAALLPVLPLLVIYKSISESGGGFTPVWRNLQNPFSPVSWILQLRTVDPFIFISRKTLPFVAGSSKYFVVLTPFLWILTALALLAVATYKEKEKAFVRSKPFLIFTLLLVSTAGAALFAPDDFGLTNGAVFRERFLICGLIFTVPLFRAGHSLRLKRIAQACLLLVVLYQTAALWEFSLQVDRDAKVFFSARAALLDHDKLASIMLIEEDYKYSSMPIAEMNNFFGFEQNRIIWDNYEIGHYLFPVIATKIENRRFVYQLTRNNIFFTLEDTSPKTDERLSALEAHLAENHGKIDALVVWGKNSRVENVLGRWFEPTFENGKIRVFRHK